MVWNWNLSASLPTRRAHEEALRTAVSYEEVTCTKCTLLDPVACIPLVSSCCSASCPYDSTPGQRAICGTKRLKISSWGSSRSNNTLLSPSRSPPNCYSFLGEKYKIQRTSNQVTDSSLVYTYYTSRYSAQLHAVRVQMVEDHRYNNSSSSVLYINIHAYHTSHNTSEWTLGTAGAPLLPWVAAQHVLLRVCSKNHQTTTAKPIVYSIYFVIWYEVWIMMLYCCTGGILLQGRPQNKY